MRPQISEYLFYRMLKKKGAKIVFLPLKYYPRVFKVIMPRRTYYLVYQDLTAGGRATLSKLPIEEDLHVILYDPYQFKYYLIPSWYCHVRLNAGMFRLREFQRHKFRCSPLRRFAIRKPKHALKASRVPSHQEKCLDECQQRLPVFFQ